MTSGSGLGLWCPEARLTWFRLNTTPRNEPPKQKGGWLATKARTEKRARQEERQATRKSSWRATDERPKKATGKKGDPSRHVGREDDAKEIPRDRRGRRMEIRNR